MVVAVEDNGRVRTLVIDRPDVLNALNNQAFAALRDELDAATTDDGVAVVVLTGAGKAFTAGADMEEMLAPADEVEFQFPSMFERLATFPKPLVAAVNGIGVGFGMTCLAHCDLVLMADDARLRAPFPQLGLAPEAGSSSTFVSVMGWQNAAHVLMTGRWFSAEECVAMGLAWKVCPGGDLMDEAMTVAQQIAANPIPSLVATKQLMLDAGRADQALAAHRREDRVYASLMGAPANAEAVAAFLAKREPDFTSIPGL